jgi:methionine-rich copper-binding protein CopC
MKKLLLIPLFFFLLFVDNVFAHTGLESSTPQNGDIVTENLEQITLTFKTKIEQGSTFELNNFLGETITVENMTIAENQLTGHLSKPLENGEYNVNWNIIGADGHQIDGKIPFTVNLPVTEESPAAQAPEQTQDDIDLQKEDNIEPETLAQEKEAENNQVVKAEDTKENKTTTYLIPTIIGILLLIVIISLFMMKRKK